MSPMRSLKDNMNKIKHVKCPEKSLLYRRLSVSILRLTEKYQEGHEPLKTVYSAPPLSTVLVACRQPQCNKSSKDQ